MEQKYKIISLGQLAEGTPVDNVVTKLSSTLKINRKEAIRLVSTRCVLREDLSKEDTIKYKGFLEKLGVSFKIEKEQEIIPKATVPQPVTRNELKNDLSSYCVHCGKIFPQITLIEMEGRNYCKTCVPLLFKKLKEQMESLKRESVPSSAVNIVVNANADKQHSDTPLLKEEIIYDKYLPFSVAYISSKNNIILTILFILLSLGKPALLSLFIFPIGLSLLRSKNYYLKITTQRIILTTGLLSRKYEEIEHIRVKDISYTQGMFEKSLNYGSVTIHSTDVTKPIINLLLESPGEWTEKIRTLVKNEKVRNKVRYEEKL